MGDSFQAGCEKAILIGTDSPWMGRHRLEQALRALDGADVVLGPARDGGYYLVGARREMRDALPEMFRGIGWGSSHVLEQSVAKLRRAGIPFQLLARDFDLDRPEDLTRAAKLLRRNPQRAKKVATWMRKWRKSIS